MQSNWNFLPGAPTPYKPGERHKCSSSMNLSREEIQLANEAAHAFIACPVRNSVASAHSTGGYRISDPLKSTHLVIRAAFEAAGAERAVTDAAVDGEECVAVSEVSAVAAQHLEVVTPRAETLEPATAAAHKDQMSMFFYISISVKQGRDSTGAAGNDWMQHVTDKVAQYARRNSAKCILIRAVHDAALRLECAVLFRAAMDRENVRRNMRTQIIIRNLPDQKNLGMSYAL